MDSLNEVSYFGAGPAKISQKVLIQLQEELVRYGTSKVGIMEISHRSSTFAEILQETELLVRNFLDVPKNYKVLFLQGGGLGQFAAVALNLISKTGKADYIITGSWSVKAAKEAQKYGDINFVLPDRKVFNDIPPVKDWKFTKDASYIFYCDNETVDGIEFQFVPPSPYGAPLVCDMSSNICSRKVDISKFGVIFAGAQKNMGAAGVTTVIVREDLLGSASKYCPSVLDYSAMAKANSILNTPPTFAINVVRRVMQSLTAEGGIEKMIQNSHDKSSCLYKFIDSSNGFYKNNVEPSCRSRMNVVFRIGGGSGNEPLEKKFIEEAESIDLLALKGHRSVGGIRVSIYTAVTSNDIKKLIYFMAKFQASNLN